jgi:hypothetical protein
MTNPLDKRIESALALFRNIYVRGLPLIAATDVAFLSFVCGVCAIEALSGYRYGSKAGAAKRFKAFVDEYFPDEYKPHLDRLWRFRRHIVHSFSPPGFSLTHNNPAVHFTIDPVTTFPILNAENFSEALIAAANTYFDQLRGDPELQRLMIERLDDREHGGPIGVYAVVTL